MTTTTQWRCKSCGVLNNAEFDICGMCGARRPPEQPVPTKDKTRQDSRPGTCKHGVSDDYCEACYKEEHERLTPGLLDDEDVALVLGAMPLQGLPNKPERWISHFDGHHRKGEPCNQCDAPEQPALDAGEKWEIYPGGFVVVDGKTIASTTNAEAAEMLLRNYRLARLVPELVRVLETTICRGCSNRIGWTEPFTPRVGRSDWAKCSSCKQARTLLSVINKEPAK